MMTTTPPNLGQLRAALGRAQEVFDQTKAELLKVQQDRERVRGDVQSGLHGASRYNAELQHRARELLDATERAKYAVDAAEAALVRADVRPPPADPVRDAGVAAAEAVPDPWNALDESQRTAGVRHAAYDLWDAQRAAARCMARLEALRARLAETPDPDQRASLRLQIEKAEADAVRAAKLARVWAADFERALANVEAERAELARQAQARAALAEAQGAFDGGADQLSVLLRAYLARGGSAGHVAEQLRRLLDGAGLETVAVLPTTTAAQQAVARFR